MSDCQFCAPNRSTFIAISDQFWAKFDPYPVSPGHALIIPFDHIVSFFDLSPIQMGQAFELIRGVRAIIKAQYWPDGWNLGVNDGTAGGRTIHHLHFHLIPRYAGDVDDPRGGIRNLMPGPSPDLWSTRS